MIVFCGFKSVQWFLKSHALDFSFTFSSYVITDYLCVCSLTLPFLICKLEEIALHLQLNCEDFKYGLM